MKKALGTNKRQDNIQYSTKTNMLYMKQNDTTISKTKTRLSMQYKVKETTGRVRHYNTRTDKAT